MYTPSCTYTYSYVCVSVCNDFYFKSFGQEGRLMICLWRHSRGGKEGQRSHETRNLAQTLARM